jgi:hypothetical protein
MYNLHDNKICVNDKNGCYWDLVFVVLILHYGVLVDKKSTYVCSNEYYCPLPFSCDIVILITKLQKKVIAHAR